MRKRIVFAVTIMLLLISCGKSEFTINGTIDKQLQIPDISQISVRLQDEDSIVTHTGVITDNTFTISFPFSEEQLAVLDLGEMGATMIAVEKSRMCKSKVNIQVSLNKNEDIIISKEGTLNNDFIQMYDNYVTNIYSLLETDINEVEMQTAYSDIINKVYKTLKGEENSLTDINSLAGIYGFLTFYSEFSLEQIDVLCSMMNKNTLKNKDIEHIFNIVQIQKSAIGNQYKDITAPMPDGQMLSLSDLVGKTDYVLVDFWASWCGPCRASMPKVKALYEQYQDKLQILGVSLDNNKEAWTTTIETLGLNWYHISDLQGWQAEGAKEYGVNAIPCTLLIDKDGVIVGRDLTLEDIEQLLQK